MKNLLAFTLISIFITNNAFTQKGPTTIAEWQQKLSIAKNDTTKIMCYAYLSEKSYVTDSAIYYANAGLALGRKYPLNRYNVWLLLHKQYAFILQGHNDSALVYSKKALGLAKKINNEYLIKLSSFFVLKNTNSKKTISNSIESYYQFLKNGHFNDLKTSDKEILLIVYNRIILDLVSLKQFEKAYQLSDLTKKYVTTTVDTMRYLYRKSTIIAGDIQSDIYVDNPIVLNKLYEDYFSLYRKAKIQFDKNPTLRVISGCMMCMWKDINIEFSRVLRHKKDYTSALIYAKKTLELAELTNTNYYINQSYIELGLSFNGIGKFQEAIFCFNKSLEIYKKGDFEETLLISNYFGLGESYKRLGNYQKGYYYIEKSINLSNKYWGISQRNQSAEMAYLYKLSEYKKEIIAQDLENKIKEERIKIEQKQKNIFLGLSFLILLLFLWALSNYKKQKKFRKQLEIQNKILEQNTKELSEANQIKNKIFALLGHDLRNPVNELKMTLMLFYSKDITPRKTKELIQNITIKVEAMHGMLNNILQWSLIEFKLQPLSLQIISLTSIVEEVIFQLVSAAQQKKIAIETNLNLVQVQGNSGDLEIVIRNLLYNAIKFTPTGGSVYLQLFEKYDDIEFICTDSGIGMNLSKENIFDFKSPKRGTVGEAGLGIGLKICQELVQRNKGKIVIESEINKGTEVKIIFPKIKTIDSEISMKLQPNG